MVAEHSSGDSPAVRKHQPAIGRWPVDDDDLIGRCRFHRADREQVKINAFQYRGRRLAGQYHVAAQRVDSGGLGLFGRDGPQPADVASVLGDVTGGEYARHPGLHPVIDEDALVDRNPGVAREVDVRADACRRQEHLARHDSAVLQHRPVPRGDR